MTEPFNCNTCGIPFATKDAMKDHAVATHGTRFIAAKDRPKKRGPYPCGHEGCEHTFASVRSAQQHRIAKHGA